VTATAVQRSGLAVGLAGAAFALVGAVPLAEWTGLSVPALRVLGLAWLMGAWWVTEALPLGLTALVPAGAFPLLGLVDATTVSRSYTSPLILLLLGGFMLARMVERTGAHRRIALQTMLAIGTSPARLVLGFAVAAAMMSMWISNTATALIMMPVVLAIVDRAGPTEDARRFGLALLLATAYGASLGGMATPVGTPPNLIAMRAYESAFPELPPLTFPRWMLLTLPTVVAILPVVWWSLTRVYPRVPRGLDLGADRLLRSELDQLGGWSKSEVRALGLFAVTAVAWVTRPDLQLGANSVIPGWASWFGLEGTHDGAVAMMAVVVAAALPAGDGERLLPWSAAVKVPWDLVLLFGGGVALATGFSSTGLDVAAGEGLATFAGLGVAGFVAAVSFFCLVGTEIISNTALANIVMPIFAESARAADIAPVSLLVPSALACSAAFMMPAATGPNAIAFGTGRVRIAEMLRAGALANLVSWALIVLIAMGWAFLGG